MQAPTVEELSLPIILSVQPPPPVKTTILPFQALPPQDPHPYSLAPD